MRGGNWDYRSNVALSELAGKTLLLMGFGRIGREVARRAAAFDMRVCVFDPFVDAGVIRDAGYNVVSDWNAALPNADILSLHLPVTPETMGLIGATELSQMKPTAILINAARGGLVDEAALFEALSGYMAEGGAGLDCFTQEPPQVNHPLFKLPNVVMAPHSAALSAEATKAMGVVAAKNIIAGLNGTLDPSLVFNAKALREAGHGL